MIDTRTLVVPLVLFLASACTVNTGTPGETGPQGPQGERGLQGIQGPAGAGVLIQSGSRLTAVHHALTGADGSKLTDPDGNSFHDTLLDVDCWPHRASDGVTRCLPDWEGYVTYYFLEETCTTEGPVAVIPTFGMNAGCTPPKYVEVDSGGGWVCGGPESVGGAFHLTGAATPVYQMSGTCVRAETADMYYFLVGAAVPDSDFVAFTRDP